MKLLKQAMAVLGTVVVITIIAALVTPKTAHALVATMVQVVNTTANPASILDADAATRTPYQVTKAAVCSAASCNFSFPAAPTGTRLIIENVNAVFTTSTSVPTTVIIVNFGQGQLTGYTGSAGAPNSIGSFTSSINSPTHLIFDPFDGSPFLEAGGSNYAPGFSSYFTLTGYTINCAVAGCPPVTR